MDLTLKIRIVRAFYCARLNNRGNPPQIDDLRWVFWFSGRRVVARRSVFSFAVRRE